MTQLRILHVDDEPDIREVVELSLDLDPAFEVRSCASGDEALAVAAEWAPDLILCDVMMPVMDGPATLVRLRQCPQTAHTPLVFMTARAQAHELEHFKSLGALGVIAKPFEPTTLASSVRQQLRAAGVARVRNGFGKRMRSDAARLVLCRARLRDAGAVEMALKDIVAISHALVGAAGTLDFRMVSDAAAILENTARKALAGDAACDHVGRDLEALLGSIEHDIAAACE